MRKDERFMIRRNNGGLGPELFLRIIKEIAEVPVGEVHLGAAGGIDAQSHLAVGEDFSEMIVVAFVVEMSAGRDLLDQIRLGIANHTVVAVQPGLAATVKFEPDKAGPGPRAVARNYARIASGQSGAVGPRKSAMAARWPRPSNPGGRVHGSHFPAVKRVG